MNLAIEIMLKRVRQGEIAVFWLGQAGFLIKDSGGRTIAIDPYLTDCCERVAGFKRLSPKLISPEELKPDVLFSTHDHPDHFDVDAVPIIMANGNTKFLGSKTTVHRCVEAGIDNKRLTGMEEGVTADLGWVRLKAVYADHGELAPDAIGVLIYIDGITVYFAGDTAYRPDRMQEVVAAKPDIAILPINGAFGNLNAEEAANLATDIGAKITVPCHFWTFAEHGGNPQKFAESMQNKGPACKARFMHQGESFLYPAE